MSKEKTNVLGYMDMTAGQNIIKAITGIDRPQIGIPSYEYGRMLEIMAEALTEEELELAKRGFGINQPREFQKEIAEDLGVSHYKMSQQFATIINKLKRSPYKGRLKALVPTLEEMFSEVVEAREIKIDRAEIIESRYRLENMKKQLEEAESKIQELEKANSRIKYDLDQTSRRAASLADQLSKAHSDLATMGEKMLRKQRQNDNILAKLDDVFARARKEARAALESANSEALTLSEIGITEDLASELKRFGITNVRGLCSIKERQLIKLIGTKKVQVIKERLALESLAMRT